MPNFGTGNFKQKNKPFKGSDKQKKLSKKQGVVAKSSKSIKKKTNLRKADRLNQKAQSNLKKTVKSEKDLIQIIHESLSLTKSEIDTLVRQYKSFKETKIVVVAAFNDFDPNEISDG